MSEDTNIKSTEESASTTNELRDEELEQASGAGNRLAASAFPSAVEREMKESGEKGGTEDINIGVGELQECTISKSMDTDIKGTDDLKR